jgi:predicted Zn-dependent protease
MSAIAEPLAAEQERLLLAELPQQLSRHAAEHGISLEWVWRGADTPAALEDAILKDAIAARERGQAAASLALLEAAVDAGLPNGWLQDNRARALVHLERIVDAVAVWRDLQARDDAVLAQETAEMLSLYGRQADRQATMDRADELLSANRVEEAIRVLSDAILADPEWDGWRHGLKRAVALQQSDGQAGDSLLQRELHDPQLALKAFDAFLRAVEQRQPNPAD